MELNRENFHVFETEVHRSVQFYSYGCNPILCYFERWWEFNCGHHSLADESRGSRPTLMACKNISQGRRMTYCVVKATLGTSPTNLIIKLRRSFSLDPT